MIFELMLLILYSHRSWGRLHGIRLRVSFEVLKHGIMVLGAPRGELRQSIAGNLNLILVIASWLKFEVFLHRKKKVVYTVDGWNNVMIPIDKSFVASKGCCASHMLHDFQPLTYIYTTILTILLMFYSSCRTSRIGIFRIEDRDGGYY